MDGAGNVYASYAHTATLNGFVGEFPAGSTTFVPLNVQPDTADVFQVDASGNLVISDAYTINIYYQGNNTGTPSSRFLLTRP